MEEQPALAIVPKPTCADCGIEFPHLHRHHEIPKSQGGTDDESNIALICPNCHALRHGGTFAHGLRGKGKKKAPPAQPPQAEPQAKDLPRVSDRRDSSGQRYSAPYGSRTVEIVLPKEQVWFLQTVSGHLGISLSRQVQRIISESVEGVHDERPIGAREINRYNYAIERLKASADEMRGLLNLLLSDNWARAEDPYDAREPKTGLMRGFRLSVNEWGAMLSLLDATGVSFGELCRQGLKHVAEQAGIDWPAAEEKKEAAS